MKKILLGVVIGVVVTAFLFVKFMPRPGPTKVIENPTKVDEKQADVIVVERHETQITSRVPVPTPVPIPGDTPEPRPLLSLNIGDKFQAPASGEIKTAYLDKSGRQIGNGTHKVTGETTVIVGREWLDIQTNFQDSVTVAVNIPNRSWLDVYAGGQTNFRDSDIIIGWEYGRPVFGNFYVSLSGSYEVLHGWRGEYRVLGRYRVNF